MCATVRTALRCGRVLMRVDRRGLIRPVVCVRALVVSHSRMFCTLACDVERACVRARDGSRSSKRRNVCKRKRDCEQAHAARCVAAARSDWCACTRAAPGAGRHKLLSGDIAGDERGCPVDSQRVGAQVVQRAALTFGICCSLICACAYGHARARHRRN